MEDVGDIGKQGFLFNSKRFQNFVNDLRKNILTVGNAMSTR